MIPQQQDPPADEPARRPEAARAPRPRAGLVGLDVGHRSLVAHWLAESGWDVGEDGSTPARCDLLVVESPFPRRDLPDAKGIALPAGPGVPVLLVSPTVLPATPPHGALAQELGVAAVLPVPLSRERFLALCARLLREGRGHEGGR